MQHLQVGCRPLVLAQTYDCIEVFSGAATLARSLRSFGYATASIDILDWEVHAENRRETGMPISCKNPLDLLNDGGFALLSPFI